jgi:hypothetical protein
MYVGSFNGVSSYVEVPDSNSLNSPSVTDEVTIIAWVKPFAFGERKAVFEKHSGYFLHANSIGYLWGGLVGNGTWREFTSTKLQLSINNWGFIALTYSRKSGIMILYLNGQSDSSAIGSYDITTGTNSRIGCPAWQIAWIWKGLIANVQIYNTALTPQEIQYLYQQGLGGGPVRLQNLVLWLPLNGDAKDYSGNNNHGTINGGVTFVQNYNPP